MEERPQLAELQNQVITNKWFDLGLQLGLTDNDLKEIQKNNSAISDCRREMFSHWLNTFPGACRNHIIEGLKTNSVDEILIAERYTSFISQSSCDLPHSSPDDSSVASPPIEQQNQPDHHTDQFMVSEVYHPLFEGKRRELASLFVKITRILKTNSVSLGELKFVLNLFPELKTDVAATESLEDAIVVVRDHTSLINTNYLQAIAENFELVPNAIDLIKKYNESINEFCKQIPTTHAYGQEFMKLSSGRLQKSEVEFVLGWDTDDKTLSDIQTLLTKAFHDQAKHVMVRKVKRGNSVIVICYAPPHLYEELTRLVKENEVELRKYKVLSVTIGRNVVLKREPKRTQISELSTGIEVDTDLQQEEEQKKIDSDLVEAVKNRNIVQIERLLKDKANPNNKVEGRTPLHWASEDGDVDIVSLLLLHGAGIHIKDKNEQSSLDLVQVTGKQEIIDIFEQQQVKYQFLSDDIDSTIYGAYATFILRQQFDSLYHSLHNPLTVAEQLSIEDVFDDQSYDKIRLQDTNSKQAFFPLLKKAVSSSHEKLSMFASVLLKYKSTVSIAQEFLIEYNEHFGEPSLCESISDDLKDSEYQFAASRELDVLFHNVQMIVESKEISLDDLVSFLTSMFPEFENEIDGCRSIEEVFSVIHAYTSLNRVSYLESIVDKFELQGADDLLKQYHKSFGYYIEETVVSKSYDQLFMHHFSRHLLKEECSTLVIPANEDEKDNLLNILKLFDIVFNSMASYVKLMRVTRMDDSINIICYTPSHLVNMFIRIVKNRMPEIMEANVVTVNIGGFDVFHRELEKEILSKDSNDDVIKHKDDEASGLKPEPHVDVQTVSPTQQEKDEVSGLKPEPPVDESPTQQEEEFDVSQCLKVQQTMNKNMKMELKDYEQRMKDKSDITALTGIQKNVEAAEVLQTTTVQSLDEKEVQLQELRAKADSLISQLREKEDELTQLKQKKLQLEEKDDLYVVDETVLTLTGDDECTLDWPDYGLHINFPKGSLPSGHTAELQIKAIVAGHFVLPPECFIMSGIYQIICPRRFNKKVTLHLRHSGIIESEEETSDFRFYAAKCSSGPPYQFKELKNGSFTPFSASIELSQFSHFAVGASRHPKQRYYSHVFYKLKQPHEWDMHFVIMKDDPAFQKFIREKYLDCVDGVHQIVKLKSNARSIKLKPENEELDQWRVTELISTQIDKEDIDYFTPQQTLDVPHCHFNFSWKSDLPLKSLNMKIRLIGADRPNDFFRVILPQGVSPGGPVFGVYSSSQPHEILKAHLSKILDAVTEPDRLANDLSSVDLISGHVADSVLNTPGLSRYDKASRLLEEFQRLLKVSNDIQKLVSFCTVLNKQDNPGLKLIANEILSYCKR